MLAGNYGMPLGHLGVVCTRHVAKGQGMHYILLLRYKTDILLCLHRSVGLTLGSFLF